MNFKDIYVITGLSFTPLGEQPDDKIEFHSEDDIFIKAMMVSKEGSFIPTHEHKYSHMSMLATGSVRAWCDGKYMGDYKAPYGIHIKANSKHTFLTLEPKTTIYCVHNIGRIGDIEIESEHELVEGGI